MHGKFDVLSKSGIDSLVSACSSSGPTNFRSIVHAWFSCAVGKVFSPDFDLVAYNTLAIDQAKHMYFRLA